MEARVIQGLSANVGQLNLIKILTVILLCFRSNVLQKHSYLESFSGYQTI